MNRRRGEVARKRFTLFMITWLIFVEAYIYIWMMNT